MKRAAIFDLDGLLIDSEIMYYQLYCELLGQYGHTMTKQEYAQEYSGKTAVENMEHLVSGYRLPITVEEGLAVTGEREKEHLNREIVLKPGALALLMYLRRANYKILLATSSTREKAEWVLQKTGLAPYFDDVVVGVEVEHGKPWPDIFLKAKEKAQEPAERCLVLEDSEAGIEAAYRAGIDVVCVPDIKTPGEAFQNMAAAVVSSLLDVIPWLEAEHA